MRADALTLRRALEIWRGDINVRLAGVIDSDELPSSLTEFATVLDYSLLAPGKRIRPALVLAAADACGVTARSAGAIDVACAWELIHTYSLVHDDLPAMDDDALRRGLPTSHIKFGDGVAILAGDAMQAEAFRVIAEAATLSAHQRVEIVQLLARAAGFYGMVGGQYLDIQQDHVGDVDGLAALRDIHDRKTGALIAGAVEAGAIVGRADAAGRARFREFGERLGWLFQLTDDVLDATGDTEIIGKPVGSDERADKSTAVHVLGLDGARQAASAERDLCIELAAGLPRGGGLLGDLAEFVYNRDR